VSAERRLAKLEGALSPKAATLLWLAEAQQFASLPAYVDWLIDQPISAAPLERVPAQARAGALEALRGQPREAVREAAHGAVRDAIFLVELVVRLNLTAEETIRIEGLRHAALFWEMRALTAEAELDRGTDGAGGRRPIARRAAAWRAAVTDWLTNVAAAEEARLLLERRYLDSHRVLFPDLGRDWETLRETGARLAALADVLPALGEGRSRSRGLHNLSPSRTAVADRAAAQAAGLADTAREAALDLLGDTEGAVAIAERRLRFEQR
jgi:hypothetical protein